MQITTPTAPASPAASGGGTSSADGSTGALISSDFETFLKMLTVQMQNQDPLNPMESTEFATQLATFSGVEQQVRTNDLLVALGAQMGVLGISQLSGWIGMQARAEMPVVFDGSPVTVTTEGSRLADKVELVVKDAQDREVGRYPIDPKRQELEWAGVSSSGEPLPHGSYTMKVESFLEGERMAINPVLVHARIVEARNENGAPVLVMESGQEVRASDVAGLRAPARSG